MAVIGKEARRPTFRNVFAKSDLESRHMILEGLFRDCVHQRGDGFACLDARILIDHRIHCARKKQCLGIVGKLVADENDGLLRPRLANGLANARIAAARSR